VRVSSGIEGWIPKKYTSEGKSKDTVIRNLKKTILTLEKAAEKQKNKIAEMVNQVDEYQATIDMSATTEAKQQAYILDLEKQVTEAQDKYITLKEQAEGVEAVYEEKNRLFTENELMAKELAVVKIENRELDQTKNVFWFLAGAGVLLVGFIMGRSGRRSRRNSLTL
jgi:SH3 domain protein